MADILIRGMEMPKEGFINLTITDDGFAYKTAISEKTEGGQYVRKQIRGEIPFHDCVELPPHGELIDRDVLYKKTAEWEEQALHICNTAKDSDERNKWNIVLTERSAFKYDIADAPVIIPADKEEDE